MLRSFEDSNIRVLIRYHEMPVYKPGGQAVETLPENETLAKQCHRVSGVEIIDVNTKQIINITISAAVAIAENINEIMREIPPPINVNEIDFT